MKQFDQGHHVNQLMIQVELPPYRGPHSPLDLAASEIVFGRMFEEFHHADIPAPLELIHSDVWGPMIQSFGHKKYYVSFINNYSKFTLHRSTYYVVNLKFFHISMHSNLWWSAGLIV
jgi:hypothetical protein